MLLTHLLHENKTRPSRFTQTTVSSKWTSYKLPKSLKRGMDDYNSPEKAIIKDAFNSLSYMDVWVCSIIEGYIYRKVNSKNTYADKLVRFDYREEYTLRYDEFEGEYKRWRDNGQLLFQSYFKEGKREGECKWWNYNGHLWCQAYYKEDKKEGENKWWWENGHLKVQSYFKEGKEEGEYKMWDEGGILSEHKIYENGKVVKDLLSTENILPLESSYPQCYCEFILNPT